ESETLQTEPVARAGDERVRRRSAGEAGRAAAGDSPAEGPVQKPEPAPRPQGHAEAAADL
ncbi:MAG: hypothetical protein AVDCRST_MAG64-2101, partial [uncultured Phycisphaerae bacterium]